MKKKHRLQTRTAKRNRAPYVKVAAFLASLAMIIAPIIHPVTYKLKETSLLSCLIPYTRLSLVLNELNDTLGAKQLIIIYTPCGLTSCNTSSKTLTIPIKMLRKRPTATINIGRGVLENILIKITTGETIPPSRITSTGRHGSALLFTWNYPALKAILYVGLESEKATLSVKGAKLVQYKPPRDCSLLPSSQAANSVYVVECKDNIYAKPLKFTKNTALLRRDQIVIRDYYCPGTGTRIEYIAVSPILVTIGVSLALMVAWAELRRRRLGRP